jgi:SSS family solute:Na+ symporter
VTLVSCIVPLAAGLYWKRANTLGAMLSVVFGLFSWGVAELVAGDATVPPQLVGLGFSILGMVLGAYVPRPLAQAHPHGGRRS